MACDGSGEAAVRRDPTSLMERILCNWRIASSVLQDKAKNLLTSGSMPGPESHYVNRTAWLRAAVLGANDGIISTASLIMGVAAAAAPRAEIPTAAVAGWAAGAMSMAAGEYVSVSSQADSESADWRASGARFVSGRPRRSRSLPTFTKSAA